MLGWFKKKFGKKQVEEAALEAELIQDEPAVAEPEEESAQPAPVSVEAAVPESAREESKSSLDAGGDKRGPLLDEAGVVSEPVVAEAVQDEESDGAIAPTAAATEDSFFSISPSQDIAFAVAGELNEFFPEPEPIQETEPQKDVAEAESALPQEVLVPTDAQLGEAEDVGEEPVAFKVEADASVAKPEPAVATEKVEEREGLESLEVFVSEEASLEPPVAEVVEDIREFVPKAAVEAEQGEVVEEAVSSRETSLEEPVAVAEEAVKEIASLEAPVPEPEQTQILEPEAGASIKVELADEDYCEPVTGDRVSDENLKPALERREESPVTKEEQAQEEIEPEDLPETDSALQVEAKAEIDEQPVSAEESADAEEETPASDELESDEEGVVPAVPLAEKTQEKPASKSLFKRLRDRLGKTRDSFIYRLDRLFLGKKEIDQDLFEQLEEILITADLGVSTTLELMDRARKKVKRDQLSDPQALKNIIREEILAYIEASDQPADLVMPEEGPFVIMVVGVNGVGKTTTIGKVAAKFVRSGQSVLLVAADTFRAAAINQLRIWGERVGVEVIAQKPGADPSSVVFDGLEYGVAHKYDVILIDTAGRLHTSVNLMEELKKIKRVIGKKMPGAPHEVMLVLDATTGQNGISQAKMFHQTVGVSGLALTKLDGTAKGGIVANVCREIGIPVRFIGIGEQIDDLRDFDAREFVDALFAEPDR